MEYVEVTESSRDLAKAAAAGPYAGWSAWDMRLEGARFHSLHQILSGSAFGFAERVEAELAIRELESLAYSTGYADADVWISRAKVRAGQDAHDADRAAVMDEFDSDDYLAEVIASERRLSRAASTSEARKFINVEIGEGGAYGPLHRRMATAYMHGKDSRLADEGQISRSVRIAERVVAATLDESFECLVLQSILSNRPEDDTDDEFATLQSADFIGQGKVEGITLAGLAEFVEEGRMSDTETAELLLPAFEAELALASSDRTHIASVDLEEHGVSLTMLLRDVLATHPDGLGASALTLVEMYRSYDPDGHGIVTHLVTADGARKIDPAGEPDMSEPQPLRRR